MLVGPPAIWGHLVGPPDSETFFFLALTHGLVDDPVGAVARAVGTVERVAAAHGISEAVQMTVATTDGESTWVFRYSTEHRSRSLFYSADVGSLRALYPDLPILRTVGDEARLVVSEPLADLPGAWLEVPESTAGVVRPGEDELRPFAPVG